jgi:hypothetical protein
MGRFVGFTASKGTIPVITVVPTTPYDRTTGITTDVSNQVTSVTLGDVEYTSILYNNVGLITSYTESIGGISKNFVLTYNGNNDVTAITQV